MMNFLKKVATLSICVAFAACGCKYKKMSHHQDGNNVTFRSSSFKNVDGVEYVSRHYYSVRAPKAAHCEECKQDLPIAFVVSAPSGCGKDTAVNALIEKNPDLVKMISVTTRKMRSNEKDHFDYHFVSKEEFEKLSKEGKLLQEATVYGESRGTLKSDFEEAVKNGKNVVFNVDQKGFEDLKIALEGKANVVGIFILPPSKQTLRDRINGRGTEKPEVIDYRMGLVNDAMKGFENYDYKIVGETKEETLSQIESLYKASKVKANDAKLVQHGKDVMASK